MLQLSPTNDDPTSNGAFINIPSSSCESMGSSQALAPRSLYDKLKVVADCNKPNKFRNLIDARSRALNEGPPQDHSKPLRGAHGTSLDLTFAATRPTESPTLYLSNRKHTKFRAHGNSRGHGKLTEDQATSKSKTKTKTEWKQE